MGQTPIHKLPYPEADDKPDGPVQIKALADATERELIVHDGQIKDLSAVRVASATSGTAHSAVVGELILTPVTFAAKANRLYRASGHATMSPTKLPVIGFVSLWWAKGTVPSPTSRTLIYAQPTVVNIPAWGNVFVGDSPTFSFPEDATVCVWVVTYVTDAGGWVNYNNWPDAAKFPDYLNVYDEGPKP